MSVAHLIRDACRRFGDRTALVVVGANATESIAEEWTYARLFETLLSLISGLRRRGLGDGDRLAILADNSVELVLSEWACLAAGFVWVALNVRSSAEELEEIIEDCRPRILLVGPGYAARAGDLRLPSDCSPIVTDSVAWKELIDARPGESVAGGPSGDPSDDPSDEPAGDSPVRIRYTSGTSGRPKGVVLTAACYQASVEAVGEVIAPIRCSDTLVQVAPMTHASGAMLLPHVAAGARALLLERFEVETFARIVESYRATSVFLVPTMLVRVLELSRLKRLSSLRTIVYGGAAMPVDRLEKGLAALGRVFVQIYGLTESTWPVTALRREEHPIEGSEKERHERLMSCGRPTAVGELRVILVDGTDAAPGQAGEILVRGRNTMAGYWRGPDKEPARILDVAAQVLPTSAEPTEDDGPEPLQPRWDVPLKGLDSLGWMHTGDIGVRDAEGFLTIIDRMHDMIVSGGFNVYPVEVERALSSHPAVLESAVVGLPDPEWGERVHASVVLRSGIRVAATELADHCAARIAPFKKPRSIVFVAELPKNAAGKILRRVVRARLLAEKSAPRA